MIFSDILVVLSQIVVILGYGIAILIILWALTEIGLIIIWALTEIGRYIFRL